MESCVVDLFDIFPDIFKNPEIIIEKSAQPVVKWAGGKRQLLKEIFIRLPINFNVYYEPFLGGGALLFALSPRVAVVNDINVELINVYTTIRDELESLVEALKIHKSLDSKEYYYSTRSLDRDEAVYKKLSNVEKAARFIYLNKTCFNGLYRVNKKNQFNVPRGGAIDPDVVNEAGLKCVSNFFKTVDVKFLCTNFNTAVVSATKGDFVYMDPPYDALTKQSFVDYTIGGFDRDMQVEVKKLMDILTSKGCKVMISNSATDFIIDLYKEYKVDIIYAPRYVGASEQSRGKVKEVLITNYGK